MYPSVQFLGIRKEFQDFQPDEHFLSELKQEPLISLPLNKPKPEPLEFRKIDYNTMKIEEIQNFVNSINILNKSTRININVLVEINQNNSIIHEIKKFEDFDVDLIDFFEITEDFSEELKFEKILIFDNFNEKSRKFCCDFFVTQETFLYSFKSFDEVLDEGSFCLNEKIELFQDQYAKIQFEPYELKNNSRREVIDFSIDCQPTCITVKDIRLPVYSLKNKDQENCIQNDQFKSNATNQVLSKTLNPKTHQNAFREQTVPGRPFDQISSPIRKSQYKVSDTIKPALNTSLINEENKFLNKDERISFKIDDQINLIDDRLSFEGKNKLNSKKTDELISKKGILKSIGQNKPSVDKTIDFDGYKLTFINCSDEKKTKSRSIQFSDKNELSTYSKPETIPQNPKILVKIYIDINCNLARDIINSLNMEKFNIIGLEIQSELMDSVDMILNWQSAVKFIFNWRVKEHQTIDAYIKTFHEKLFLFDSVLLVYVHPRQTFNASVKDYLEKYSEYLRSSNMDCFVISIHEISQISSFLNLAFKNYFDSLKNFEIWNQIQEEISDMSLKTKDSSVNIYAFNVLMACRSKISLNFTDVANCLGLSTKEKYLKMEEILKNCQSFNNEDFFQKRFRNFNKNT